MGRLDDLIRSTPASEWFGRHRSAVANWTPWLVGAALALGLIGAAGGPEAFGIAVGVLGALGTVAAAIGSAQDRHFGWRTAAHVWRSGAAAPR